MTDIITLPQHLSGNQVEPGSFYLHKYTSDQQILKNRILLRYNLISFLQTGEKVIHYANKTTAIFQDQIAVLSSGKCLMTEKLSTKNFYSSTLLFFDNSALTNFFVKYRALIYKGKAQTIDLQEPFVIIQKDDFIKHFILSMDFVLQRNLPYSQELLQLKFEEIMLYLLEKHPEMILSLQASKEKETVDFEIRNVVEKNIITNITLEELAFLCHTSVSTFKRRFIKVYNSSPSQYFLQRKMELAASMLLSKENPTEVSYKVGYENPSSFSQSFKQVYGMSPRQYQQQYLIH